MTNTTRNYYSGGFAEIVSNPSAITYSYLKDWLTGKSSLGKAMEILGLPYQEIELPVLELVNGELVVNLQNEEKTLYANTIFKYAFQKHLDDSPKLNIDLLKTVNPFNWAATLSILLKQSVWISNPQKIIEFAKEIVKNIPEVSDKDVAEIEQILTKDIWPTYIAVGFLSEFFNQLIKQESGSNYSSIHSYVGRKQSAEDWFFQSISEQAKVKSGELSFKSYIEKYGKRSDKDYELTSPRWYEIEDIVRERIKNFSGSFNSGNIDETLINKLGNKLRVYLDSYIALQILRSEARRKTLLGIDILRKKIKPGTNLSIKPKKQINEELVNSSNTPSNSQGLGVSAGTVSGKVKFIVKTDQLIPEGSICVFPNAGTEFSIQYPKCQGMIFLKGGQTSHGSIVAREFGIPAIIDNNAKDLKEGTLIIIDGEIGSWKIGQIEEREEGSSIQTDKNIQKKIDYIKPGLGGKASALKKLESQGLPVPVFFVLESTEFQKYAGKNLSEDFKKEVLKKFDSLDIEKVAVRSSATSEDSSGAAWAGQLETYLNVTRRDLVKKIEKCWDSINTERVREYIKNKKIKEDKLLLAVIVQKMINSEFSGVTFTVNPVTKAESEIVIEAGLGLGEKVVQGKISPDRFLLDRNFNIKSKILQGKSSPDDKQILELGRLALNIERIFNCPQDIEWAIDKNSKIWILQSRPITTL